MDRSAQLELLKIIVRPFVRYCLRHSHSIQDFIDVAKVVFVEEGADKLRAVNEKVNVSRLSVITGLYRSDVARIFKDKGGPRQEPMGILARVVGQWRHDSRFITKAGKPRVLGYSGDRNEFRELVESVSKSINSGTVLFELERMGAVIKDTKGKGAKLLWQMPGFSGDPREGFSLLSRDLEGLLVAVEENLTKKHDLSNLHMRTEYDNIVRKALPQIKVWFLEEGKAFHKRARNFLAKFDKDLSPGLSTEEGGARVALTAFSQTSTVEKD